MDLSESDREDSLNLLMNTLGSSFRKNEMKAGIYYPNEVWNTLQSNDIPKLYINATTPESDIEKLDKYLERMGNTERVNLSGLHEIFLDKPDDCSNIIVDFLNDINED